jgi:hypothetical protein
MNLPYEIHITVARHSAEAAARVAAQTKWKTSEIARDPHLGDATFFYLTTHAESFEGAKALMFGEIAALKHVGVQAVRSKIEHVVYDTKTGIGVST